MEILRVTKLVPLNKYLIMITLLKAAVAGAGLALAALAAMDIAIANIAKEAWDAWQVDQFISRFAIVGAVGGTILQILKLAFLR